MDVNQSALVADAPVDEPPLAVPAGEGSFGSALLGTALLGVTVAIVIVGIRARVDGGIAAVNVVAFCLTLVWAAVGFGIARRRGSERVSAQVLAGLLVAVDSLAAAVALTAGRLAVSTGTSHGGARAVATIAAPVVTALSFQLLLSLPDGRLVGKARWAVAITVDVVLLGIGVGLAASHRDFTLQAGAASWSIAAVLALPAMRARYMASAGRDRERLQWLGIGAVVGADFALVAGVLHALVGWPGPLGAVAAGGTVLIPIGLVLGDVERLATDSGRIFVHVLSIVGFTVVVSIVYLLVVLGLGHAPTHSADREVLALSMLAAGVAAVGYVPARDRLFHSATRFVYGSRQAPDEVLRTFGSRLTRAIPMDELLLQLAESLRKTMGLTSAEVYTGMGDVLERAVSVPDQGPRSLVVTGKERPVVTRAGVSGNAWASVWLPELLDGRQAVQLRVAPISHGGELLGLIVVERPSNADVFGEDEDRVLADLARQVGLAFHNSQLDTALQTTLDELRKQADALRESRARIVASGDAERRRVERNLHDGAQQRLVALAVNLRLAREIIAEDPTEGAELLDQLATEVQETIQELRELAHGIYPPLLVDSGLGEALRAAANRSPLSVGVKLEDVGRYPSEVEAAVYFCCLEALQNAAKHAPQAHVVVRVWQESGGLLFAVSDDGPGFDVDRATRGHGFTNMADRLGAIGGTVRWESEPGNGSVVRGSLPLI